MPRGVVAGYKGVVARPRHQTLNMPEHLTATQYDLVYNLTSLGMASMGASTAFFFLRLGSFHERYKAALCFTGLVTFIAFYHYMRIFNSFEAAYTPCMKNNETGEVNYNICNPEEFGYSKTGIAFNDAYRYVDWLLTVPLLLIEIVLVMKLDEKETFQRSTVLGVSSALMIANGYPGETSGDAGTRWTFWALSMAPFCYIVYTLFVGLKASQDAQPMVMIQMGYTFSDIISKCGVGYLVYRIGLAKSMMERGESYDECSTNEGEVERV